MTEYKQLIDEIREQALNRYLQNDFELKRDLDIEKHDVNGYHGRELLELLQNVDDAAERQHNNDRQQDVIAHIKYSQEILTVSNTGTVFDLEGIKALVFGHISAKGEDSIGSKGSGFRGLLNWADKIQVFSGKFKVEFSQDFADSIFTEYKSNPNLVSQAKKYFEKEKRDLHFPMLSMPKYIDEDIKTGYDTTIRIYVNLQKNIGDFSIEKQIDTFDYRTLLFLPNLNKVEIETENGTKVIKKDFFEENDLEYLELTIKQNNQKQTETFIFKKRKLIKMEGNKYLLIAIPLESVEKYPVYCYFPTQELSPFPVLMHAPFKLSPDRNNIPTDNDDYNKDLCSQLIDLLVEMANEVVSMGIDENLAVKIVTPNNFSLSFLWNFEGVFSKFNLRQQFFDAIKSANIFPTVNRNFTTIKNGVKYIEITPPKSFTGEGFELLLNHFDTKESNLLIEKIANLLDIDVKYNDSELVSIINEKSFSVEDEVDIFLWWSKNYKYSQFLPSLLKDTKSKYITAQFKYRIFLPTDTGINTLPKELDFVNLIVLSSEYTEELIKQIKAKRFNEWGQQLSKFKQASNKRILSAFSDKLAVNFIEQSSRNLIIREINNQIKNKFQGILFFKWLYKINEAQELDNNSWRDKIEFNLPTINGVQNSGNIYFSSEWDNVVGEKVFKISDSSENKFCAFVSPSDFGEMSPVEIEQYAEFATTLGVKKFPQVEKVDLCRWDQIDKPHFGSNVNYIDTFEIKNLKLILETLSTQEITKWIKDDNNLHDFLVSRKCDTRLKHKSNSRGEFVQSNIYTIWFFNTIPWVEIEGIKYAPFQIVTYPKLKNNCKNLYGISENELIELVSDDLYKILDFRSSFGELDSEQIKMLLDDLPIFDKGEVSRKLYEEIIKFKAGTEPLYETKGIQVLCKDGEFYNADSVKYADKRLPSAIANKVNLLWAGEKHSTSTIKNWLGVERYKSNLKINNYELSNFDNKQFLEELNEIKVMMMCLVDMNNVNKSKIRNLEIVLCREINAVDLEIGDSIISLDMFSYLEDVDNSSRYYFVLPNEIRNTEMLRKSDGFCSAVANIFRERLNLNFDLSLLELLVSRESATRKQKIADEFSVDKWNEAYGSFFEKSLITKRVQDFFASNGVTAENLAILENIDFFSKLSVKHIEMLTANLKSINKDVNDLNESVNDINIDIREHWRTKIYQNINENLDLYKTQMYESIKPKNIDIHRGFCKELIQLENHRVSLEMIENSIYFSVEDYIKHTFKFIEYLSGDINIDEVYKNNFQRIKNKVQYKHFADFIDENLDLKSFIYFLHEEYEEIIMQRITEREKSENCEIIDKKSDFIELGNMSEEKIVPSEKQVNNKKNACGAYAGKTSKQHDEESKKKARIGKTAEKIAYDVLKKTHPSLKWTSENADEGLPERNTSKEYDMYYLKGGNKIYVEIKAFSKSFFMSKAEYDFAVEQGDCHEIYFVDIPSKRVFTPNKILDFEKVKDISEFRFNIECESNIIM